MQSFTATILGMKSILLLFVLCYLGKPQIVFSQSNTRLMPTFNHAAICVQDLKRSTAFYHNVLALDEIANPFNDGIHAWFKIGPNLQLHVIQRGCAPIVDKNIHLCFSVVSLPEFTRHLEQFHIGYTNLKGEGTEPTVRADGVKQIYLQDPDGYWLEINDAH